MTYIDIYTDGSSRGNPGPAGWGSVIFYFPISGVIELGGRADIATNNRMELMAVYQSLVYIEEKKIVSHPIQIYIDSSYVQKGITLWMYAWEKNGWKTKEGAPVANQDIWQELLFLVFRLKHKVEITFLKIEGHMGHFGNERADVLATSFADNKKTLLFKGAYTEYKLLYGDMHSNIKKSKSEVRKKTGKAYSYVSSISGVISVDADWASCEARVKGKKGAIYKKVFSKAEENALVHEYKKS